MPNVHVKSYGCSANTADAEIAKGVLIEDGHALVDTPEEADINIIVTCVVKTPTEQKISRELRELEASGKPLIVAGCMPKSMNSRVNQLVPSASMVGPDDIERMAEAVHHALNGKKVNYINGEPTDRTCLPRVRANNLVHIAPISTGCLGNCSYCIVKFARGNLCSFPAEKIIKDITDAVADGCLEVWVTAEDTALYNHDGIRLPELLNMITAVEGEFRVRVGMTTPNSLDEIMDELIASLDHEKMYKFIHIPIQAGNDEILHSMRRKYTLKEFKEVANKLRAAYPEIGISTDIICGFPGETEEQFQDSLDLVTWLRPDVLNINRFWERPGTDAATMPGRLHGRDTKQRSRRMTNLWKELAVEVGERWLGWEGEILLTEDGKNDTKVGRNYVYKTVAVKTDAPLGSFIRVKVKGAGVGFLTGDQV
ncbi:tRNA (N(6)-L-threonylcarbamoyladenosine(37)-C(2))-methylthiotransferase [Candidatus Bathyarchaeota archaeon]|mgnify:CR=1 FL=1|jgi:threonylcarbamoyladenosine tRNA methylthiotransferase CDKAL1|nr:tRNA (N(6)-L-threonylcarbamoyladenosine(37)-C(2))-methylthiotransferase [Candidatus Bathyarchaeota archaeon]MBT4320916.1 tRNA (N(6)-L-threonylcarbamoyladenosine(37)-C(2))-methylthiotransferase [Candidatus Bathyarchaeota archaeon]MBT4423189.1 tRNA (N(6)-L-threonylcarbamoyladenosine(37)-C(2))-methylthiotransferase [Candidatus Bathyarchaeota archaeon]MBT6605948.1 tRNA (N(6)-L-threonylcarbamoyladenosine(37)-C(2))-methylthiotransferase [Candidatus Bathyarchaeota archaeon]MBT7187187.1 tRNA (N(6)-L